MYYYHVIRARRERKNAKQTAGKKPARNYNALIKTEGKKIENLNIAQYYLYAISRLSL